MSTDVTIFGISPRQAYNRHYAFVDVVATLVNRRLLPVTNPIEEFPSRGNVHVDESFWIPPVGTGALWRVRRTDEPGERTAEFSAIARGRPGPLEIISVPVVSATPDTVREFLVSGVTLGYAPADTLLIELDDGVVIGPVKCEPLTTPGAEGFRCRPDAFAELLLRWDTIQVLEPFPVREYRRIFTSYLDLPASAGWYDAAEFGDCVRAVVKYAAPALGDPPFLTRRQLVQLSRALSDAQFPEKLSARARRVAAALESAALTRDQLDAVIPAALANETVKRELDEVRAQVRAEEAARVSDEEAAARRRIAELKKSAKDVEAKLVQLHKQVVAAEREGAAAAERVVEQIRQRFAEAANDPAGVLASVALLRPFLAPAIPPIPADSNDGPHAPIGGSGTGSASRERTPSRALVVARLDNREALVSGDLSSSAVIGEDPSTAVQLCARLADELRANGLVVGSARLVARDVIAAGLAGQMPVFAGSIATLVASTCAVSCAGGAAQVLRVPVGLLDDSGFRDCLDETILRTRGSETLSALVVEGLNRSAFEVYGEALREMVAERVMGIRDRAPALVVLGTLATGPAALPATPALCELGPIIDTDTLTLSTAVTGPAPHGQRVSSSLWRTWATGARRIEAGSSDISALCSAMAGEESLLWKRVVAVAHACLQALADASPVGTPAQALVAGWLLPRAAAAGVPPSAYEAALRDAGVAVSGTEVDPRVTKLLARLGRAASAAASDLSGAST